MGKKKKKQKEKKTEKKGTKEKREILSLILFVPFGSPGYLREHSSNAVKINSKGSDFLDCDAEPQSTLLANTPV